MQINISKVDESTNYCAIHKCAHIKDILSGKIIPHEGMCFTTEYEDSSVECYIIDEIINEDQSNVLVISYNKEDWNRIANKMEI